MKKICLTLVLLFLGINVYAAPLQTVLNDLVVKNGPWVDVRAYGTLPAAVSAIGATQKKLVMSTSQTLTNDLTIPANIQLVPVDGALIRPNGHILTYSGSTAGWPSAQVFDMSGGGKAVLAARSIIKLDWYGVPANGTDATAAFNTVLACIGTKLQTSYFPPLTAPYQTVLGRQGGTYLFTDSLQLRSNTVYDFNNSTITFAPTSLKNLFTVEPSFSVGSLNIGMHVTVKNFTANGDYQKTTDTGYAGTFAYFDRTSFCKLQNFTINGFRVGVQFGLDKGVAWTDANYYNRVLDGAILNCREVVINDSSGNFFTNVEMGTGSGVYSNPPTAMFYVGAPTCVNSCTLESAQESGIASAFEVVAGGLVVNGGYQENAGYLATVDLSVVRSNPYAINIHFATSAAQGIKWINDGAPYTRTRYLSDIGRGGSTDYGSIQYNHVTGQGLTSSLTKTSVEISGMRYPNYSGSGNVYAYFSRRDGGEIDNYVHVITKGALNYIGLTAGGTYTNDLTNLVDYFVDGDIYHYVLKIHGYGGIGDSLTLNTTSGFTLLNLYTSNSYKPLSVNNKQLNVATAAPDTGTWTVGDKVLQKTPIAGGTVGWVCTTAGTLGTLTGVTATSDGSNTIVVNDASNLHVGDYLTISAVGQLRYIVYITGTSVVCNSTVSAYTGSPVIFTAPVFKTYGTIGS